MLHHDVFAIASAFFYGIHGIQNFALKLNLECCTI